SRGQIPLAMFPGEAPLPTLFDASLLVVVVGGVGTPLALHLTLETADGLAMGSQFSAGHIQAGSALARDERNGGQAQIYSNRIVVYHVFGLVIGDPLERGLDEGALALLIGPPGMSTARLVLDQAGIFDASRSHPLHLPTSS